MLKIPLLLLIFLLEACAIRPPQLTDLTKGAVDKAIISADCESACAALVEKNFQLGRRGFDSGITGATLYEVNGVEGGNTFRCADCAGTTVNAFNDSWSGKYSVAVPAGAATLVVSVSDYRVREKMKYQIKFRAEAGRRYAVIQVHKNPSSNEDGWMAIVVDTVENRVIHPGESRHWLRR